MSIFSSIAGRLPALQRVQFENLAIFPGLMIPESAQKAERFVAFGGPVPMLQYEDIGNGKPYIGSDRGTHINGPERSEPPSGLWQDYESIANEFWVDTEEKHE
jgi:hypothetical protein